MVIVRRVQDANEHLTQSTRPPIGAPSTYTTQAQRRLLSQIVEAGGNVEISSGNSHSTATALTRLAQLGFIRINKRSGSILSTKAGRDFASQIRH